MNTLYYISIDSPNAAKRHIDELANRLGFKDVAVKTGKGKIATFFRKVFSMINLLCKIGKGDTILIQYPFKKFYVIQCNIAHFKGAKVITLIHDLGTFRRRKLTAKQEIKRLSHSDVIICHNKNMNDWLKKHGCQQPLVNLEIFDYLSVEQPSANQTQTKDTISSIVFAGGISRRKSSFIYSLDPYIDGCKLELYGSGLEPGADKHWKNIVYHGSIASDEFIRTVAVGWGLVWDGESIDGCTGMWGSYLKINNPHKTSFYLRAGIPVIVWSGSAMAPFIIENKLGISVGSLRELPERLRHIKQEEYETLKQNAKDMSVRLNDGFYFKKALNKAIRLLGTA